MKACEQDKVISAADRIRRYLETRPNAAETVEGVAKWWLARQRYADSVELAQQALDYLENKGKVVRFRLAGGKVMYRRA